MGESPHDRQLRPVAAIQGHDAYRVARHPAPVDLWLAGNEGRAPAREVLTALSDESPELLRRYPSAGALEARLAARLDVDPTWVLVTAGADDALDRTCRAMLAPGREMVLPVPTFEMLDRYASLTGADVRRVPWSPSGPYPRAAVLEAINERTAVVAVVSPNNPTGAVATADDVRALAAAAPHALILIDGAYDEFAEERLTEVALTLPNALLTRTLSKAYGVAGLRVGYAVGQHVAWLRRTGNPYAVSSVSLALAARRLDDTEGMTHYVAEVKRERDDLLARLRDYDFDPPRSQGNFVFVRDRRTDWLGDGLAGLGIAVRRWPGHPELADAMRITVPGVAADYERLVHGIAATLRPEAILFSRPELEGAVFTARAAVVGPETGISGTLASLGVTRAWMVGDTPEDMAAARAAGVVPIGWGATSLVEAGAARVMTSLDALQGWA
ncbi:MAG: aminotransferase class I/II-fold pyridoxal phosphate-dependent enzyme [Myxococcota bacterium]